jgi:hypothetical protein
VARHQQEQSKVGLGSVENTALSTWAGTANITAIGTLASGSVPWARLTSVPSTFAAAAHAASHAGAGGDAITSLGAVSHTGNLTFGTDNAYDIGASGANRPRAIYAAGDVTAGGNVVAGATSSIYFTGCSAMWSSADGNIGFGNSAGTAFGLLQLGGTTASFPAIKRSATSVELRLANDSAYTDLNCKTVSLMATSGINLYLGGWFASYPALKRNAAAVAFRLADDSGDASITAAGATMTAPLTFVAPSCTLMGRFGSSAGVNNYQFRTNVGMNYPHDGPGQDDVTQPSYAVSFGGSGDNWSILRMALAAPRGRICFRFWGQARWGWELATIVVPGFQTRQ